MGNVAYMKGNAMKTKQQRAAFVAQLQAERVKFNDAQQLARLDKRLGKNMGAQKERARLTNNIVNAIVG